MLFIRLYFHNHYFQVVVNALIQAIPSIANVMLVCIVFWLIFSIMGVQLFGGKFHKCVDADGTKLPAELVPNKTTCMNMTESHGFKWINADVNFDHVFKGYLSLFQVVRVKNMNIRQFLRFYLIYTLKVRVGYPCHMMPACGSHTHAYTYTPAQRPSDVGTTLKCSRK